MAVIEKKIKLMGSKGEIETIAIFDSGATYSCIQPQLAKKLEIILPLPQPKLFGTAESGRRVIAKERVSLDFILNGYTFSDEFMVIPELSDPVIIGAATLQKWRMKLDFENEDIIIDPKVTKLRLLKLNNRKNKMNLKYENYKNFLDVILEMLKNKTNDGILSVVLYGSVARGKARPESDIDLLILYDREKTDLNKIFPEIIIKARETKEYKELFEKGIYAEVSPYIVTVEELRENPLILLDIMNEGIILYEKGECFRELIKKFREKLKELGSRKVYLPDGTYYWELKPDWKPGELVEIKI